MTSSDLMGIYPLLLHDIVQLINVALLATCRSDPLVPQLGNVRHFREKLDLSVYKHNGQESPGFYTSGMCGHKKSNIDDIDPLYQ